MWVKHLKEWHKWKNCCKKENFPGNFEKEKPYITFSAGIYKLDLVWRTSFCYFYSCCDKFIPRFSQDDKGIAKTFAWALLSYQPHEFHLLHAREFIILEATRKFNNWPWMIFLISADVVYLNWNSKYYKFHHEYKAVNIHIDWRSRNSA